MHLTPREIDKLILHQAGFLAQKRLARGLRLNYVESMALIATQLLEFIRDGRTVSELMDVGRRLLGIDNVLDGVAEMIDEVQVEGTFPDGTKLVTVHHPIVARQGRHDAGALRQLSAAADDEEHRLRPRRGCDRRRARSHPGCGWRAGVERGPSDHRAGW
jgi:urease gamma subunit